MDVRALRSQHQSIIEKASVLGGLCGKVRTRSDARAARAMIDCIDRELVAHLTIEDEELYPVLMDAQDAGLRFLGAEAFEGVGGLLGLWLQFRDHWTVEAILGDPRRFAEAAAGLMTALSMRVELEEDSLYPAAEAAARRGPRASGVG